MFWIACLQGNINAIDRQLQKHLTFECYSKIKGSLVQIALLINLFIFNQLNRWNQMLAHMLISLVLSWMFWLLDLRDSVIWTKVREYVPWNSSEEIGLEANFVTIIGLIKTFTAESAAGIVANYSSPAFNLLPSVGWNHLAKNHFNSIHWLTSTRTELIKLQEAYFWG